MIRYEAANATAIITLDRPEAHNAINGEMASQLEEAIDRLENDDSVWVGILAAVPPTFCAGADLKVTRDGGGRSLFTHRGGFAGITARERRKPIIAAVDGPALAGGTEIVLACDIVVASRKATFGLPEVKRSLLASAGGLFRLGRKIPINIAMELLLTGQPIDAHRAREVGLVNQICDAGEAVEAATQLANLIQANAPLAVVESRQVVLDTVDTADEVCWELSKAALKRVLATEDYREGLQAFVEKRDPQWKAQ